MSIRAFHYLPVSEADSARGLYITTVGHAVIPPGVQYPPGGHPETYRFEWAQGRVLHEHVLVYIARGKGTFDTGRNSSRKVESGHLMVLFPETWHRYRPVLNVGWEEYWVGFGGAWVARLLDPAVYTPKRPVLRPGVDGELLQDFEHILHLFNPETPHSKALAAALAHSIIAQAAFAHTNRDRNENSEDYYAQTVQAAKLIMHEHLDKPLGMEGLAARLGIGYSSFRHQFKQHTGLSPKDYLLEMRIERARNLLTTTHLSVKEIADTLSFGSPYHFMRLFKQRTGKTPSQWRHKNNPYRSSSGRGPTP